MLILQCTLCKVLSKPTDQEWKSDFKVLTVTMPYNKSSRIHLCPTCVAKLGLFDKEKPKDPEEEFLTILHAIIEEAVDERMSQ